MNSRLASFLSPSIQTTKIAIEITLIIDKSTIMLNTFQVPRMKTPAAKNARIPASNMKGCQLS